MAAEKNNKTLNVPNLRFPEFCGEWEKVPLSKIATRVTRKNKNNESQLPLTISAQYGLVDQVTFFNKVVASSDMSNYYLLHRGEFAYNKSYSGDYPWGAIKRLDRYDQGALSSLYICFTPTDVIDSDFLVHYFESPKWYREVSNIAGEGARNHGLLNIAVPDFFNTQHCITTNKTEQRKIADFLNLINDRIETQKKVIKDLKKLKYAISKRVFENHGSSNSMLLGKVADIYQPQTIPTSWLNDTLQYPVYGANGVIGKYSEYNHENSQICIACRGNTCGTVNYSEPKSWITGNAMVINTDRYDINKRFLFHQLCTVNYSPFISGSGQPQIVRAPLEKMKIWFPNEDVQERIATLFDTLEDRVLIEETALILAERMKQYLLSQLFI